MSGKKGGKGKKTRERLAGAHIEALEHFESAYEMLRNTGFTAGDVWPTVAWVDAQWHLMMAQAIQGAARYGVDVTALDRTDDVPEFAPPPTLADPMNVCACAHDRDQHLGITGPCFADDWRYDGQSGMLCQCTGWRTP